MAINQLNKYVWLVETIHRARKRGGITLKEIQSRWKDSDLSEGTELSRRTFINNLHSIEELFEISISCGSGYRYYIEYGDCFEEGRKCQKLDDQCLLPQCHGWQQSQAQESCTPRRYAFWQELSGRHHQGDA